MSAYVERYKDECIHVKACPKILKISIFMNGINNPELIKRLNDRSSNHNNSYRNQRGDRGNDKYTPLTKTPKEILATEGANFPKPPPMRTPEERRVGNGYCEYHRQKGYTTNECVQLRQLIDKLVKEGRLDHLVKNIKEGKDKQKSKVVEPLTIEINAGGHDIYRMYIDGGESTDILYEHCFQRLRPEVKTQLNPATTSPSPYNGIIGRLGISAIRAVPSTAHGPKDKADTIYMVQSWQRKTRQKVGQKFSRESESSFPTLTADNTVVEPLTIEINAGGHDIYRMYIDGGESTDILYEHCFQRLRPEVKTQLNPATTSPSPYNGIIGRLGISAIRAVPSTAHGMLKFPVDGRIVTIYNTTVPPRECNTVACDATQTQTQHAAKVINLKVVIYPDYPEKEVSIGGSLSDRGRAAITQVENPGYSLVRQKKQLCDNPFKDWCAKLNITQHFASVKHPQTNGLVKRANRSLGEGIKARLDKHKGRWVEELSHVLWAHRTTKKVSTEDTPFSLVYGTEAVIPAKIGMPTIRTAEVNVTTNDDERRIDLDILEERRERAAICEAKAKSKMKGYYDAKVRGVSFRPGDFVYHANGASHVKDAGKLGPKWEGPYEVTEAL
nr:reverse transcriptase domain-containing protein [Tanacetum cinerariifolium]